MCQQITQSFPDQFIYWDEEKVENANENLQREEVIETAMEDRTTFHGLSLPKSADVESFFKDDPPRAVEVEDDFIEEDEYDSSSTDEAGNLRDLQAEQQDTYHMKNSTQEWNNLDKYSSEEENEPAQI